MQISILNITQENGTSKTGRAYQYIKIAFRNESFGGKVEGKDLYPFGNSKPAYDVLSKAQVGQSFDVTVQKNTSGYNDWVAAVPAGSVSPSTTSNSSVKASGGTTTSAPRSNFETPEERAKRQVYIVRQSSVSSAIAALSVGSKTPPKVDEVLAYAGQIEDYVFGKDVSKPQNGDNDFRDNDIINMMDDIPM